MYVEDINSPDHQVDSSRYNSKSCLLNKIGQPKKGGRGADTLQAINAWSLSEA